MRAIFIATGAALLNAFHWMIYIFGGFLVLTGVKLFLAADEKIDPEKNPVLRLVRRILPVTKEYQGQRFFIRTDGRLWATPLLLVLVVVETTDVVFAVDSIPAIFAITLDPFIVYTSNVFAILGLRALYFLLAGVMGMFRYLKVGLSFVLCFVGVKMMLVDLYKIPIGVSLGVVAGILILSVLASMVIQPNADGAPATRMNPRSGVMNPRSASTHRRPVYQVALVCLAIVFATLVAVKLVSIFTGPSAYDAIVAIRVAERDLSVASIRGLEARAVDEAKKALNFAWQALEEKRYAEALSEAQKSGALTRRTGK